MRLCFESQNETHPWVSQDFPLKKSRQGPCGSGWVLRHTCLRSSKLRYCRTSVAHLHEERNRQNNSHVAKLLTQPDDHVAQSDEHMAQRGDFERSPSLFSFPIFDLGSSLSGKRRHSIDWPYTLRSPEFSHHPMALDRSFRLLKILHRDDTSSTIYAQLEEFALHECPSYYALSYTWGEPMRDEYTYRESSFRNPWHLLLLDGQSLSDAVSAAECSIATAEDIEPEPVSLGPCFRSMEVGRNLRDCFRRISDFEDWMPAARKVDTDVEYPVCTTDYFWINAICIDQSNHIGKATQIPLMDEIYGNAELVIVWLRESPEEKLMNVSVWMHTIFEDAIY